MSDTNETVTPKPKRFLLNYAKSVQDLEDWMNSEELAAYDAVAIADTDSYITGLMKLREPAA